MKSAFATATRTRHVSPRELFAATWAGARTRDDAPLVLVVGDVPVAEIPPPGDTLPVAAQAGAGVPLVDVLSALAGPALAGPALTGLLVLHSGFGPESVAFFVRHGRVMGAVGPGPTGTMGGWLRELAKWHPRRVRDHSQRELAARYVEESLLELLDGVRESGARLMFFHGECTFMDTTLDVDDAPCLQDLLQEHTRRWALQPALERAIPSHGCVPLATGRTLELHATAMAHPELATHMPEVLRLCTGRRTVAGVLSRAMLGRTPGLQVLALLRAQRAIKVYERKQRPIGSANSSVYGEPSNAGRITSSAVPLSVDAGADCRVGTRETPVVADVHPPSFVDAPHVDMMEPLASASRSTRWEDLEHSLTSVPVMQTLASMRDMAEGSPAAGLSFYGVWTRAHAELRAHAQRAWMRHGVTGLLVAAMLLLTMVALCVLLIAS